MGLNLTKRAGMISELHDNPTTSGFIVRKPMTSEDIIGGRRGCTLRLSRGEGGTPLGFVIQQIEVETTTIKILIGAGVIDSDSDLVRFLDAPEHRNRAPTGSHGRIDSTHSLVGREGGEDRFINALRGGGLLSIVPTINIVNLRTTHQIDSDFDPYKQLLNPPREKPAEHRIEEIVKGRNGKPIIKGGKIVTKIQVFKDAMSQLDEIVRKIAEEGCAVLGLDELLRKAAEEG